MDFEWDPLKSRRNDAERGLPFDLAILLFGGHVIGLRYANRKERDAYRAAVPE